MIYVVNFVPNGIALCKGASQLAEAINHVHRTTGCWIHSIVPVNYCEWLYAVYEFEEFPYNSKPFRAHKLQKVIDYIHQDRGRVIAIYQYHPGIHPVL